MTQDHIALFKCDTPGHCESFANLLVQRGERYGRSIPLDYADAVRGMIGREYESAFLFKNLGEGTNPFRAIATSTMVEASFIGGKLLYLENFIVDKEFRGQGYDLNLWRHSLIYGWEKGFNGIAWDVRCGNDDNSSFLQTVDPSSQINSGPAIWHLSRTKASSFIDRQSPLCHLAATSDLEMIVDASRNSPDRNYDYLIHKLLNQINPPWKARSFIIGSEGGFAIASHLFSPIEFFRVDVRIYLGHSYNPDHINTLVKGVAAQIERYSPWNSTESLNITLHDDSLGSEKTKTRRLASARKALRDLGCELLKYSGSRVISHTLSGKKYVAAVIDAACNSTIEGQLSPVASQRLRVAAQKHGLGLGQAV